MKSMVTKPFDIKVWHITRNRKGLSSPPPSTIFESL
jgi:hypothetical protein